MSAAMSASPVTTQGAVPAVTYPFGPRLLTGIFGVFVAAMMSGLNSRIGGLALTDVRTAFGMGLDDGSWISSLYAACELAALPFSTWFATTFSLRRYHMVAVVLFALLAIATPFAAGQGAGLLLTLRCLHGFVGGMLIPVLMSAALRFFPQSARLYGLAVYAMTATFAPNVAIWMSAWATDTMENWHLLFWQLVPMALFSLAAVGWGLPQDPVRLERLRQMDWLGLAAGLPGLVLIGIALTQGERLDWFNSMLICWAMGAGVLLVAVFLIAEWFHPSPFVRLQLLHRRNLGLGFLVFVGLLIVMLSGSMLPANYLAHAWHFRTPQLASIGLQLGLPQLVLGPAVSWLLYRRWLDARHVFAAGLVLIAAACWAGSQVTSEWMAAQFAMAQALNAVGQAMAVVALLFLVTSVLQPIEGAQVSGIVNMLRAFGSMTGGALLGRFVAVRGDTHGNVLLDQAMNLRRLGDVGVAAPDVIAAVGHRVAHQALVLSIADAYLLLGSLALLLVPAVLALQYVPAPPRP